MEGGDEFFVAGKRTLQAPMLDVVEPFGEGTVDHLALRGRLLIARALDWRIRKDRDDPPDTLNSSLSLLLRPARRRTEAGTTIGVLFLTMMVIFGCPTAGPALSLV